MSDSDKCNWRDSVRSEHRWEEVRKNCHLGCQGRHFFFFLNLKQEIEQRDEGSGDLSCENTQVSVGRISQVEGKSGKSLKLSCVHIFEAVYGIQLVGDEATEKVPL